MPPEALSPDTVAGVIARFLKERGVDRIFALCGGHIMPIWMRADAEDLKPITARTFCNDPAYRHHLEARTAGSDSHHFLIEDKDDLA